MLEILEDVQPQAERKFRILPPEERKRYLDASNPTSPYFGFIGNRHAIDKLIRIDFTALGRINHLCSELSFSFLGPGGLGKTDLARRHAKANKLPFVEISPKSVKTPHDIFVAIQKVCENPKDGLPAVPLVEMNYEDHFIAPPLNLFIDEVHALPAAIIAALLKPIESKDGIFATEKGIVLDCRYIHWVVASTERGLLPGPFDSRFSKIILNPYTKDEIAQIIQSVNDDWPLEACQLVAHYCSRIPRESLAFAREMQLERNMNPELSWKEIALKIAKDNRIDEYGLSYQRLAVLKALSNGPIGEKKLPAFVGVQLKELQNYILPWLMAGTDDQEPMISTTSKGFCLTIAGVTELDRRGIPHKDIEELIAA